RDVATDDTQRPAQLVRRQLEKVRLEVLELDRLFDLPAQAARLAFAHLGEGVVGLTVLPDQGSRRGRGLQSPHVFVCEPGRAGGVARAKCPNPMAARLPGHGNIRPSHDDQVVETHALEWIGPAWPAGQPARELEVVDTETELPELGRYRVFPRIVEPEGHPL